MAPLVSDLSGVRIIPLPPRPLIHEETLLNCCTLSTPSRSYGRSRSSSSRFAFLFSSVPAFLHRQCLPDERNSPSSCSFHLVDSGVCWILSFPSFSPGLFFSEPFRVVRGAPHRALRRLPSSLPFPPIFRLSLPPASSPPTRVQFCPHGFHKGSPGYSPRTPLCSDEASISDSFPLS